MKPQEYWGDSKIASDWIQRAELYDTRDTSSVEVLKEFEVIEDNINTILEVGAGNGRLISKFADKYKDKDCFSLDINEEMSIRIRKKYDIMTYVNDITKGIHLPNFGYDFVYTYQVLQHVHPDDIENVLKELYRITGKELWLFEGWGDLKKLGVLNGHMRHSGDGGTFYWDFERMIDCYETKMFQDNGTTGIKLYKIKRLNINGQ